MFGFTGRSFASGVALLALVTLTGLLTTSWAMADELRLHAVFGERAVLSLGEERAVVAAGETGPGGVRVLRTSPGVAVVEFRGHRRELRAGRVHSATRSAPVAEAAVRVHRDSAGEHALTAGVNGVAVTFVVDLDLAGILVRASDAARAGLDPTAGRSVRVRRATGILHGQRLWVDRLEFGGLRRDAVSVIVLPDSALPRSRLGQGFFDAFVVEHDGEALVIREH